MTIMGPELDAALVRDFPRLYRDRHGDTRETRMCDGFPGDGWEPIIRRLSEKLEPIARETGLRAVQVKEKFGALRCYVRGADGARKLPAAISEAVHAAIIAAMEESGRTCEHCGAAGSTRKVEGWWSTLCDACLEREQARRAERKRRWREGREVLLGAEIRVFLDDVREAPAGWKRAYTAREAIALLEAGGVVEVSLDHDLGDETTCGTGYEVATWIEEAVATRGFVPPTIRIHSANVVGRERMQRAIESIERLRAKGSAEMTPVAHVVRIVSGGQTGADRGGLDAALALGIEHGGWCPAGRVAEDGQVPRVYALRETTSAEYAERTKANVRDSDGTVVFTRGAAAGGSAFTLRAARRIGKPVLHVDLAKLDVEAAAERVRGWCAERSIAVLNVAGSRESKAPGIGDEVRRVLLRALVGEKAVRPPP
jgi:hypothetical protein